MIIAFLLRVAVYFLAFPTSSVAAFVVPLFTQRQNPELPSYSWGWIFGTYDNPPQGDREFVSKRAPFPNVTTGIKGYINRVQWMRRNRLYGLKRKLSVDFMGGSTVQIKGDPDISDKYRVQGTLRAVALDSQRRPYAFEYYKIWPYSKKRCVRIRFGWKIQGRKFTQLGDFAPLVFTINPFDGYGD